MCRRRWFLPVSVLGWLMAACGAVGGILSIDLRPGPQAPAPAATAQIEASAREAVAIDASRPTLIVFFHPKCPCSRATAAALNEIAAEAGDRLAVRVVRLAPANDPLAWQGDTTISSMLGSIPHARFIDDVGGRIADAFGAKTSGHCVLYSAAGRREFAGGITPSRGHAGESKGRDAIEQLIAGRTPLHRESEVYGCLLHTPAAADAATEQPESLELTVDRKDGACTSCQQPQ